jgi:hypothetical protein
MRRENGRINRQPKLDTRMLSPAWIAQIATTASSIRGKYATQRVVRDAPLVIAYDEHAASGLKRGERPER